MLNKDQFADNHFIRTIIEEDLKSGKHTAIQTRFPPEPNGYLHIGHAKSICLNFGLAYIYDGLCNLRFDDTNPEKENDEYVNAIKEDVEWLGFHWAGEPRFASNYFDQLYDYAVGLIKDGKAYVDDLTPEEMREYRGTLTEAGKNSPYRDRSVEENLDLFTRMKNGEFLALDDNGLMTVAKLVEGLAVNKSDLQSQKIRLPKYRALYLDGILKEGTGITLYR
ncbi:MAG: SNF2 helicase associated domain-containing protein, partial [Neisseria sp.]|nr:SNF2 helicase associated domain-containing protein [Neisseria sp.]